MEGDNIAYVQVRENETLESALRRFKKQLEKEGIIKEYKDRQYYVKPSQKKHEHDREIQHKHKRKMAKASKKHTARSKKRKKQSREQAPTNRNETSQFFEV